MISEQEVLTPEQEKRRQRWANTVTERPEVIKSLPEEMRSYVKAGVEAYTKMKKQETQIEEEKHLDQEQNEIQNAKLEFAKSRSQYHTPDDSWRLPEAFVLTIVVTASAVIFGAAAQNLAEATGKSGGLATAGGVVVGILAGFLADEHGKKVFTGLAMKQDYQNTLNQLKQQGEIDHD